MDSDNLTKLVGNLPFLQYVNSIHEVNISHLDFPENAKCRNAVKLYGFGIDVVKKFLHIGVVKKLESPRVLLTVWPSFTSPTDYRMGKKCFRNIKKVKVMIFLVPEEVFDTFSEGTASNKEIVAAVAILRPKEEWILLEKLVISSFFHLVFDKTDDDLYGDKDVWDNFSIDNLDCTWKQILFLCCGPRDLAYQTKKLLKRNWTKIARNAVLMKPNVKKDYITICKGDLVYLLVFWTRFAVNHGGILIFLKAINAAQPTFNPPKLLKLTKESFAIHVSHSKRYRCTKCVYETNKRIKFDEHLLEHEVPQNANMDSLEVEQPVDDFPKENYHEIDANNNDKASHDGIHPFNYSPEEYDLETDCNNDKVSHDSVRVPKFNHSPEEYELETDNETDFELFSTQESVRSLPKIRRSRRLTETALKDYADQVLYYQILTGSNELLVDVFMDPIKGRGCRAAKDFVRNEFVLEYKGKLLERKEAVKLEEKYADDYSIGSFMYFFTHKNKQFCLDATEESPYKARLISHSVIKPNLKVKLIELNNRPYLVLRAAKDISFGEELLFNYGETRADIVKTNPWLINS